MDINQVIDYKAVPAGWKVKRVGIPVSGDMVVNPQGAPMRAVGAQIGCSGFVIIEQPGVTMEQAFLMNEKGYELDSKSSTDPMSAWRVPNKMDEYMPENCAAIITAHNVPTDEHGGRRWVVRKRKQQPRYDVREYQYVMRIWDNNTNRWLSAGDVSELLNNPQGAK